MTSISMETVEDTIRKELAEQGVPDNAYILSSRTTASYNQFTVTPNCRDDDVMTNKIASLFSKLREVFEQDRSGKFSSTSLGDGSASFVSFSFEKMIEALNEHFFSPENQLDIGQSRSR